ncbi:MAG: regulatory protein RecX [Elusimicrobia bacterium]|nr:regulatory protein RecX [Elusimicrobiota bacterium]
MEPKTRTAWNKTLAILNRRVQSEKMLGQKLQKKGFGQEEIRSALTKAKDYKLLDDRSYAEMLIKRELRKGYGPRRIQTGLFSHGISQPIIKDLFESMRLTSKENQEERLREVAAKKSSQAKTRDSLKFFRYLVSLGYDSDVARRVCKITQEGDEDV